MRGFLNFAAILLIIFGIISLSYNGFTYTKSEKLAQVGSVEVTADKEKAIYLSPTMGGLALAVGLVLVVLNRMNAKP